MGCYFIQGFHINNRTHTTLFHTHDLDQAVKFFNDYIFDDKDDIESINLCAACCEFIYDYFECHGDYFPCCCDITEMYETRSKN